MDILKRLLESFGKSTAKGSDSGDDTVIEVTTDLVGSEGNEVQSPLGQVTPVHQAEEVQPDVEAPEKSVSGVTLENVGSYSTIVSRIYYSLECEDDDEVLRALTPVVEFVDSLPLFEFIAAEESIPALIQESGFIPDEYKESVLEQWQLIVTHLRPTKE